jgi:hypothetical protein
MLKVYAMSMNANDLFTNNCYSKSKHYLMPINMRYCKKKQQNQHRVIINSSHSHTKEKKISKIDIRRFLASKTISTQMLQYVENLD